jgi:YgiT-type zinc finger domain-containing protein
VKRKLPDDPLEFIRRCVRQGRVFWTYHVNMRLRGRFITRQAILQSNESYEILEEYPRDKYLPSYLVYSEYQSDIFHVLFALDLEGVNVRIVTAYRPNPEEWERGVQEKEEHLMRCSVCGSKLSPLITDLPFKVSDTSIVILKGLPVLQCDNCREYLLDDLVMNRVEEILQRADAAAELEIIRYAA